MIQFTVAKMSGHAVVAYGSANRSNAILAMIISHLATVVTLAKSRFFVVIDGFDKYCLSSWNALSHSTVHSNFFPLFKDMKQVRQ